MLSVEAAALAAQEAEPAEAEIQGRETEAEGGGFVEIQD